ncbi:AAA ATPase central domain protein [Methanolacinia petrolearia DSM 11571]|uniref:AAA ATPase central domain protein n=1 Tax=Methanolacinia petrolearia (strain DSM 11571 / OCM 486 / SEBR 4847) TaxID=679926 RepID=E1RHP6_METP4|nr:ATP-binding protein [Methanolacinia petrolearia]ADN35355.1 AAA ATPase central domain protein [Methanolacinia petrolearia DSM 11571]
MNADDKELAIDILEFLITADIINKNEELTKLDLPKKYWKFFGTGDYNTDIDRPITIGESLISKVSIADNAIEIVKQNPFVKFDEFGKRFGITTLDAAAAWFLRQAGKERIMRNPVLARYYEKAGDAGISYKESLEIVPRFIDSKEYLEAKVNHIIGDDEELKAARGLIIISSPEEIEYSLDDLVCTPKQEEGIKKIEIALKNREFLKERRIFEFGKLLFVGPPGTGKTSLALAMSKALKMPLLEVRLAMVTSQYLGETSKNIDRIFDIARRLSPCILFIDEFDFVAKSRVTEDNGAMKRAVNMLLKNIDTVSFVRNGVVLIGATNHPALLDEAAWRRFDDVIEFPLPDYEMRVEILKKITSTLDCTCDFEELAAETEGFSGADLRIMIKESIISALMRDSFELSEFDVEQGMGSVRERDTIRQSASI